jgi:hypothetical protein
MYMDVVQLSIAYKKSALPTWQILVATWNGYPWVHGIVEVNG